MYHVKVKNRAARVTGWQKSFRKCLHSGKSPERSKWTAAQAASGSDSRILLLQDRTKRQETGDYTNITNIQGDYKL